jgi:HTH-type transcriptional regulator / antitoxin HipB
MRITSPLDFGAAVKGRRIDLGISQSDLAKQAGTSRKWISEFERGKPTAEVALVLAVLEALSLDLLVAAASPMRGAESRAAVEKDNTQLRALLKDLGIH